MRKNKLIIYFLLITVLLLAGCGNKKNKETGDTTEVTSPSDAVYLTETSSTEEEPQPEMDEYGYYIANDSVSVSVELASVYVSADTSSAIYMLADNGNVMNRTGYNDTWTRVVMQNTSFYVLSSDVTVIEQPAEPEKTDDNVATPDDASRAKKVVIDAGNQANASISTEAVGPGSGDTKACASAGITGTTFGTKESELNLKYALLLKTELEDRGYEVVLTRDTNDIDLSNKARADIANASGASAYIRIEMNQSSNAELNGVMAVCMSADSPYNSSLYQDSKSLSTRILQGITESVDVTNCGIYETDQMTAINWSQIPVAEIHLGFLTNATDEGNLISEEYQKKLVTGIANGIDYFIK